MSDIVKFDSLKKYLKYHLYLKERSKENELEIRFGTNKSGRLSKINYDNIIRELKSNNFTSIQESGDYMLRIKHGDSPMRGEIHGLHCIQEYCKNTQLSEIVKNNKENVKFANKTRVILDKTDGKIIPNLDNMDFNFRIGYNLETEKSIDDTETVSFIMNSKASNVYRYINRVSYVHKEYPVRIDCSVVKMNSIVGNKKMFKEYKVFESSPIYEVEIEIDNEVIYKYEVEDAYKKVQSCIKMVLQGLQETYYPIPGHEMSRILGEYNNMVKLEKATFIGPSSVTLQLENLREDSESNILKNYTVTDKADGMRKLLYISSEGRLYFITTNMQIQYTGVSINFPDYFNTLLDGEHILYDKNNEYVNVYAAFDCYYVNKKSKRDMGFGVGEKNRYKELAMVVQVIVEKMSKSNILTVNTKTFYAVKEDGSLFNECNKMLTLVEDSDKYNYNTDGLIFTPIDLAVGANKVKEMSGMGKTWKRSFKWKPPEFNTIDFMVTLPTAKEIYHYSESDLERYMEINLRVGFNTKQHGILNPLKIMLDGKFDEEENVGYQPALFYPTSPYDNNAHICHVLMKMDANGTYQMFTEENEIFGGNMIVEFKYVESNEEFRRWIPLRVRYDKTYDLKTTGNNFGNAYHVANNNWHSIHRPITEEMIRNGLGDTDYKNDIYYEKKGSGKKRANINIFHNKVKSILINYVVDKCEEPILLDIAVGKGGDIRKWFYNKNVKFVLGIDLSRDNIENKVDGACKRYIDEKRKNSDIGTAIFLAGDSSKNIRDGTAFDNIQMQSIASGVFGMNEKNRLKLGDVVYKNYGIGSNGFDVVSCQFALHYYFKSKVTLRNLFINLVECTKIDGYFIGTCYDGERVFNMLKEFKKGESKVFRHENGDDLLNLTKKYEEKSFMDESSSIGYTIEVFQESINKGWDEYLVNMKLFKRLMENYGFIVVGDEEIGSNEFLKSGIESFEKIYKRYILKNEMELSSVEKEISNLNIGFVFKKIRHVDVNEVKWGEEDIYEEGVRIETGPIEKKIKKIKIHKKKIIDKIDDI